MINGALVAPSQAEAEKILLPFVEERLEVTCLLLLNLLLQEDKLPLQQKSLLESSFRVQLDTILVMLAVVIGP